MTLPSSGPISISQIAAEFGGTAPHSLSEYYGVATGVPSSGTIDLADFYGTSNTITLQVLMVGGGGAGGRGLNEAEEGEMYTGGGGAGGEVNAFTLTASGSDASGVTFSLRAGRGAPAGTSELGAETRLSWDVYSGQFSQTGGWRVFTVDSEEDMKSYLHIQGGGGQGGDNNAYTGAGGASNYGSGRTSGATRPTQYTGGVTVSGGNAGGVPNYGAGGGAGYSSGSNASTSTYSIGGAGGAGVTNTITGSSVVYGGGGGGGGCDVFNPVRSSGGSGGGGAGGSFIHTPVAGTDGLGGGGGGAGARTTGSWEEGGRGGGGCVYISSSVNPSSSSGVTITGSGPYLIALTAGASDATGSFTI